MRKIKKEPYQFQLDAEIKGKKEKGGLGRKWVVKSVRGGGCTHAWRGGDCITREQNIVGLGNIQPKGGGKCSDEGGGSCCGVAERNMIKKMMWSTKKRGGLKTMGGSSGRKRSPRVKEDVKFFVQGHLVRGVFWGGGKRSQPS